MEEREEEEEEEAMAVGLSITGEGGKSYNGRVTSFVVLSCMMATMGGIIFGYDIGISGLFIYIQIHIYRIFFRNGF